jgi:hypothetical protein
MATDFTIQDHHMIMFTKNVELLLQQRTPRFLGLTNSASYQGENAQVVLQLGDVEMSDFTAGTAAGQWKGDTQWEDPDHYQRWVFPTDKVLSLAVTKQDELRMLVSPLSPYAEAMRAAYARAYDDFIIAAALGTAKTGRFDDLQDTAFPSAQIIDDTAALTIDKLITAKEMLIAANNDPSEPRYFACSEKQLSDLLRDTKVQSADYNTIRALVKGDIDTFVGFKFISTERLALDTAKRKCFAWVKSGLHVGMWNNMVIKSDPRPDKNYVQQLWMTATLGATRTQEAKVVQVNCTEA